MTIASFDIGEKNFAYCIANDTCAIIRWVRADVVDSKRQTVVQSCVRISQLLDAEKWTTCTDVVIEQQMTRNVRAQRVAQHVWTWFHVRYPLLTVAFVPSHLKTQTFLGKNALTNKERKAWSVEKTIQLLTERGDIANLSFLKSHAKKDDLCDAYLQLVAVITKNQRDTTITTRPSSV